LRGVDVVEALDQLAVKGTKALVGHWFSFSVSLHQIGKTV
jgi:hypothetical protein